MAAPRPPEPRPSALVLREEEREEDRLQAAAVTITRALPTLGAGAATRTAGTAAGASGSADDPSKSTNLRRRISFRRVTPPAVHMRSDGPVNVPGWVGSTSRHRAVSTPPAHRIYSACPHGSRIADETIATTLHIPQHSNRMRSFPTTTETQRWLGGSEGNVGTVGGRQRGSGHARLWWRGWHGWPGVR